MGKRSRSSSSSESDDVNISKKELWKRLDRLERRLKKKHRKRSRSRSAADEKRRRRSISRQADRHEDRIPRETASSTRSEDRYSQISPNYDHGECILGDSTSQPQQTEKESTPPLILENDIVLEEDFLVILGEDPQTENINTTQLNKAITSRWVASLRNGLPENALTDLKNKYIPPSDIELHPPEVNPELSQILSSTLKKKDVCYSDIQTQVGRGLTALGLGLDVILRDKENIPKNTRDNLLEPLWDAGKLYTDLFSKITEVRRSLLLPVLNESVRDIAEKTSADQTVFGSDFGEKIKKAKLLEQSGKELLPQPPQKITYRKTMSTSKEGGETKRSVAGYSGVGNPYRPSRTTRDSKTYKGRSSKPETHYKKTR
nr:uncharacterized protein LOC111503146 [Leptinotarsa decemlineata]